MSFMSKVKRSFVSDSDTSQEKPEKKKMAADQLKKSSARHSTKEKEVLSSNKYNEGDNIQPEHVDDYSGKSDCELLIMLLSDLSLLRKERLHEVSPRLEGSHHYF